MIVELFDCGPLSAKLTEKGCAANQERARQADRKVRRRKLNGSTVEEMVAAQSLACCLDCPGVRAIHGDSAPTLQRLERDSTADANPRRHKRRLAIRARMDYRVQEGGP